MLRKSKKMNIWEKVYQHGFIKPIRESLKSMNPRFLEPCSKGFTLIEIIVVIVILSIASAITIKFLVDSLRIYTMTVNQKTLLDEGKLALERMCRDIRDARRIIGSTASSITFTRTHATPGGDGASENIRFDLSGTTLRKVKNTDASGNGGTPYPVADNITSFTVNNTTNEIQLQLTLSRASGENVTLQTKVYPKNLPEDLGSPPIYKNFDLYNSGGTLLTPSPWQEVISP
jgi:prepilin-type N-terminal cleavage/methylation domain-containing protein